MQKKKTKFVCSLLCWNQICSNSHCSQDAGNLRHLFLMRLQQVLWLTVQPSLLLSPALYFLKVNHLPELSGILMLHKWPPPQFSLIFAFCQLMAQASCWISPGSSWQKLTVHIIAPTSPFRLAETRVDPSLYFKLAETHVWGLFLTCWMGFCHVLAREFGGLSREWSTKRGLWLVLLTSRHAIQGISSGWTLHPVK